MQATADRENKRKLDVGNKFQGRRTPALKAPMTHDVKDDTVLLVAAGKWMNLGEIFSAENSIFSIATILFPGIKSRNVEGHKWQCLRMTACLQLYSFSMSV